MDGFADADDYRDMTTRLSAGSVSRAELLDVLRNDFEPVVFRAYPVLGDIKESMLADGAATAFMSGSGSSMVAIFDHAEDARRCADNLKNRYPVVHTTKAYPPQP